MSINCVKLRFGEAEVKVAGSHDDLAEVAFELLQRMSKLHPIMNQHSVDFSCENDNLDSISSNDSSESNVTVHNSYSGTSVQQMARHRNCNTGSQLALVACEYLHFVKRNTIFSRKEILSAMRDSVTFYKDSDSGNLTKILKKLVDDKKILNRSKDKYCLSNKTVKSSEKYLVDIR